MPSPCTHDDAENWTEGVFFHGSPRVNIAAFNVDASRAELNTRFGPGGNVEAGAVFFTEFPADAAGYAANRAIKFGGMGGRVYCANLTVRNPYFPSLAEWHEAILVDGAFNRSVEGEIIADLKRRGFDAIIPYHHEGKIHEIAVLQSDQIRPLDPPSRLIEWDTPRRFEALTFYRDAKQSTPDFAPGAALFSAQASPQERAGGRIAMMALCPVYCPAEYWPAMDFAELRTFRVDCLIDPVTGDALALDHSIIEPASRSRLRVARKRLGR